MEALILLILLNCPIVSDKILSNGLTEKMYSCENNNKEIVITYTRLRSQFPLFYIYKGNTYRNIEESGKMEDLEFYYKGDSKKGINKKRG